MGTTGASTTVSTSLSGLLTRIRSLLPSPTPLAVGFGVSTRAHFEEVGREADGVVIGSQLVSILNNAKSPEERVKAVQAYCQEVSGNRTRVNPLPAHPDPVEGAALIEEKLGTAIRFGDFGGAYVPEALYDCLEELSVEYDKARADPAFWKEWEGEFGYMNRPSQLYEAKRLTEMAGGARIWFKREDLNHTGSHKVSFMEGSRCLETWLTAVHASQINNAIGQILLAKRIGKKRIIAETGAGQHGVATATVCAKFGLECIVYMGAEDIRRQGLNVFRMRMLGAKVVAVASVSGTLKDAISKSPSLLLARISC